MVLAGKVVADFVVADLEVAEFELLVVFELAEDVPPAAESNLCSEVWHGVVALSIVLQTECPIPPEDCFLKGWDPLKKKTVARLDSSW